jgi:hypothetical protein
MSLEELVPRMNEQHIQEVAAILQSWNPLGERAATVRDLDGYRTEAIDLIFALDVMTDRASPAKVLMELLNEAFDLTLNIDECKSPAQQIVAVLRHS